MEGAAFTSLATSGSVCDKDEKAMSRQIRNNILFMQNGAFYMSF